MSTTSTTQTRTTTQLTTTTSTATTTTTSATTLAQTGVTQAKAPSVFSRVAQDQGSAGRQPETARNDFPETAPVTGITAPMQAPAVTFSQDEIQAMLMAAKSGNTDAVKDWLDRGMSVAARLAKGHQSALGEATRKGHLSTVQFILEHPSAYQILKEDKQLALNSIVIGDVPNGDEIKNLILMSDRSLAARHTEISNNSLSSSVQHGRWAQFAGQSKHSGMAPASLFQPKPLTNSSPLPVTPEVTRINPAPMSTEPRCTQPAYQPRPLPNPAGPFPQAQPLPSANQAYQPQPLPSANQHYQPQPLQNPNQYYQPQPLPSPSQYYQPQPLPSPNQYYQPQPLPSPNQYYQPQPLPASIPMTPLAAGLPITLLNLPTFSYRTGSSQIMPTGIGGFSSPPIPTNTKRIILAGSRIGQFMINYDIHYDDFPNFNFQKLKDDLKAIFGLKGDIRVMALAGPTNCLQDLLANDLAPFPFILTVMEETSPALLPAGDIQAAMANLTLSPQTPQNSGPGNQ